MASVKPEKVVISGTTKKPKYVSKGERYNTDPKVQKEIRQARSFLEREMFRLKAWRSGKTPKGMESWSRKKWPDHDKSEKVKVPEDLVSANTVTESK